MYRDAFRLQGNDPIQGIPEAVRGILGQSGDQIHIDIVKAHGTGKQKGIHCLLRRMLSANGTEHRIVQSLGIDGNPVSPIPADHFQLLPGDGVRSPRFYSIFPDPIQVHAALQGIHDLCQLLRRNGSRRTAADVHRVQLQMQCPDQFPVDPDLPAQAVHIGWDQFSGFGNGMGHKGAVAASAGAEGNGNVQTDGIRGKSLQQGQLHPGSCLCQRQLFL